MKKYVEQLLNDINEIMDRAPCNELVWIEDEEDFNDLQVSCSRLTPGQIVGIEKEQLPPLDELTAPLVAVLEPALEVMLEKYNIILDLPEDLPCARRYHLLGKQWDTQVMMLPGMKTHIEFCDYDYSKCPYPDFCRLCLQYLGV